MAQRTQARGTSPRERFRTSPVPANETRRYPDDRRRQPQLATIDSMSLWERATLPFRVVTSLRSQFAENTVTRDHQVAAWARFVRWQTIDRLRRRPKVVPFANDLALWAHHGAAGSTGVVYFGLPELESMAFFAHALRREDLFVDVGANIGAFSVLAAGISGCKAVALEPVPETYLMLRANITLNSLDSNVEAINVAVSDRAGSLRMTDSQDSTNHVLPQGSADGIVVPSITLDEVVIHDGPVFVKIDIEGHEKEALAGGQRLLASSKLKAVVMEFGCGTHRGIDEGRLYDSMLDRGFLSCRYELERHALIPGPGGTDRQGNTIFVRDIAEMNDRLRDAPSVHVLGLSV